MLKKLAFLLLSLFILAPAVAGHAAEEKKEVRAEAKTVNVKLLDLELVDQDGKKVRFKSEVIGDRVAAIVPFYTTCTTAYPILIFIFTRLQDMLGDRLGKEVVLVALSVDPRTDIPIRLKAFARRQKAKPGWLFLSGEMTTLSTVLAGIGIQYIVGQSVDEHQHVPLTLVGDARGEWKRFYGYPPPEVLMTQINNLLAVRGESGGKK
jgi:protein SCO1/2